MTDFKLFFFFLSGKREASEISQKQVTLEFLRGMFYESA